MLTSYAKLCFTFFIVKKMPVGHKFVVEHFIFIKGFFKIGAKQALG